MLLCPWMARIQFLGCKKLKDPNPARDLGTSLELDPNLAPNPILQQKVKHSLVRSHLTGQKVEYLGTDHLTLL
jgi:hypothetical protein